MSSVQACPRQGRLTHFELYQLTTLLLLIVVVRGLPRWILGVDSFVTIHDNLDSDLLYRVLINRPGRLFDYSGTIPEMLGGLPRWTFPSGLKFSSLVFHFHGPFIGYALLEQTVSLVGGAGMWLLLRDFVPSPWFYRFAVSVGFALLPFMPIYDCSVSGQPWVLWALLSAWYGRAPRRALAVCFLFSFFSVLQMSGLFVVAEALIGVGIAALWHRNTRTLRSFAWPFLCAVALGVGYLITDFGFLSHYLFDGFVSHRDGYTSTRTSGSFDRDELMRVLLHGRYHAASHHEAIAVVALATCAWAFWRGRRLAAGRLFALCLLAVPVAFSAQLFRWPGLSLLTHVVPTVGQITPRFWWSLPLLWYLIWGVTAALWPRALWGRVAFALFFVFQLSSSAFLPRRELATNYQLLTARLGAEPPSNVVTYRAFRSARVVSRIRRYVRDRPGRFLCLGFHPSVLQFGGLRTVDGYRDLYPLEYKNRFRELIADDLARNSTLTEYFETFGGRVYYFYPSAEPNRFSKNPLAREKPQKIHMSRVAAQDLGVRWVVSTFKVRGPAAKFLKYRRRFRETGGFLFYLYEMKAHGKSASGPPSRSSWTGARSEPTPFVFMTSKRG